MKSNLFSFKSMCCMAIALGALVLIGGVFSPAQAEHHQTPLPDRSDLQERIDIV